MRRIAAFKSKLLFTFLFALLFSANTAYSAERNIHKETLENGMTIILERDTSAPVVTVQMWVEVGGADETDKESGLSHVFEHMLFKGTKKRGVGDIAKEVESHGGDINAYTSFDRTVYFLTLPSRHSSLGIDIISDAVQNSAFDNDELMKELEVVKEEIRMGEDNPGRNLYKLTLGKAYDKHNYGRPVIGSMESVNAFTRDDILNYFNKWYVPNNMNFVIVGDIKIKETLAFIKKSFKDFKSKELPDRNRTQEPKQKKIKVTQTTKPVMEAKLALAYHIPGLMHEDVYALDVLAGLLSQGASSRLIKNIKLEKELVHGISAYAMTPKDPGLFMITASLENKNVYKTVEEVIYELEKLKNTGATGNELEKVKLSLESDFIYSRDTMAGKANQLGMYETLANDLMFEKKYIEGINKVSSKDIKNILIKYFYAKNMTIGAVLSEEGTKIKDKKLKSTVSKSYKKSKKKFAKKKTKNIEKTVLTNGITLIVKEDHSNETVAFYSAFKGGIRYENEMNNGIGNFMAGMLKRGTEKYDIYELSDELESIAGSVGGYSGRNSAGVSGKFLSKFFDKGMDLASEVILRPTFPEDEIEKARKDILASIKRSEDYLPGYTFKLLYKELYNGHPYGMAINGVKESIEKITKDDLKKHYEKIFVPENMIITVVGDIDKEYVKRKIKELFVSFNRKATAFKDPIFTPNEKAINYTGDKKDKEQLNIGIGFVGPTFKDKDRIALNALKEVLSNQGGRLFLELRDKKSLAYSVSAFTRSGIEPGIFGIYIGSAPDKKKEAMEGIMAELKKVINTEVTKEELDRAKNSIISSFEIGLQDVSSQASNMATNEFYGFGYDYNPTYIKLVEKLTVKDLKKAAKKYITLDNYTVSIVGP